MYLILKGKDHYQSILRFLIKILTDNVCFFQSHISHCMQRSRVDLYFSLVGIVVSNYTHFVILMMRLLYVL